MFPRESFPVAIEGFEVLERLGAGAVGEVFLARSPGGRLVAIKTIAGAMRNDDQFADSFAREASVCARLRHPCIVQVRAFREHEGVAALVFEYVPGVALARVVRLCESRGVRLPDRAAWRIVERVLSALAYAHGFRDERGQPTPIVHRDVSPSNVLLDWTGGVKIADFGIAKVLGVSPATRFGLVKGTLGCMAPEQARGEPVDERADAYAAALLAWRLSTGRNPFGRGEMDDFELLRAMRNPRIKPLSVIRPDLPASVLYAITQALEPEPARRAMNAGELASIIRAEIDVDGGEAELGALLARWKPILERSVKRSTADANDRKVEHTLRYEEVALAFDDDPAADAPTFEGHALPIEPWSLDSLPEAAGKDDGVPRMAASAGPTPGVRPPAGSSDVTVRPLRKGQGQLPEVWRLVLTFVFFAVVGIVVGVLSVCTR
ncbi:MAG: serine/threonine-protein kinase [Polyangiaceae bacterium]|jgi:serine/threonine-protein kinase